METIAQYEVYILKNGSLVKYHLLNKNLNLVLVLNNS